MKRRTALPDLLLLSGTLFAAFVLVATIQRITGRLDGVASMVFLLGAFLVSLYTEGSSGEWQPACWGCWR